MERWALWLALFSSMASIIISIVTLVRFFGRLADRQSTADSKMLVAEAAIARIQAEIGVADRERAVMRKDIGYIQGALEQHFQQSSTRSEKVLDGLADIRERLSGLEASLHAEAGMREGFQELAQAVLTSFGKGR